MKLRKFLLICSIVVVMSVLFAISISAVDYTLVRDDIESIVTANTNGNTRNDVEHMFDGNLDCASGWYPNNGWAGPTGSSVTITFKKEYTINAVIFYGWSNWNSFYVNFYDALGNETGYYDGAGYQVMDGSPTDFGISDIKAKSMVINITYSKGWGNMSFTEFFIVTQHTHDYSHSSTVVKAPSCAKEGLAEHFCECGDSVYKEIEPHGQHVEREMVVFRNGFTNPGYKATVCINCDTKDTNITDEIGPLFTSLGYSVREDGQGGIQYGFCVNYENIELFNSLSQTKLQFGTVVGSRAVFSEGNPMQLYGVDAIPTDDKIVAKDYTNSGYDIITCKISGFGSELNDTQLILAAYVCDGYNVYYLGEETTMDIVTKSYNDIRNISATE